MDIFITDRSQLSNWWFYAIAPFQDFPQPFLVSLKLRAHLDEHVIQPEAIFIVLKKVCSIVKHVSSIENTEVPQKRCSTLVLEDALFIHVPSFRNAAGLTTVGISPDMQRKLGAAQRPRWLGLLWWPSLAAPP